MLLVPSPKVQLKLSGVLSGSAEPPLLNATVSGAGPLAGLAVRLAVGGRFSKIAVSVSRLTRTGWRPSTAQHRLVELIERASQTVGIPENE